MAGKVYPILLTVAVVIIIGLIAWEDDTTVVMPDINAQQGMSGIEGINPAAGGTPPQGMAKNAGNVYNYTCNLGGVPARLTTKVEVIGSNGIVTNPQGWIKGVIGTGDYTIYYEGQLVSQTANYVFTGENQYADFTDLNTNERFRVQVTAQGNQLLLVANPFGPGPTQYLCQLAQ